VVRFGECEGTQLGQGFKAWQPLPLLLVRTELVDHAHDEFVVDAHQSREGYVSPGDFGVHEALEQLGGTVGLKPAEPELGHIGEQPEREFLAIPVVDAGRSDARLQELPDLEVPCALPFGQ